MPFRRNSVKHRRYPYGPGAEFAIGSGERLAAKRRETAQMKGSMRRYPGMPQAMGALAGGMFGNGQSTGHMDGLGVFRQADDFDGFEQNNWENPTAARPHPFSGRQRQSPFTFASNGGPAFGRQQQSFWPGGAFQESNPWHHGVPRPLAGEDLFEEPYARRGPGDDYLDEPSGFGPRHFAHSFQQYLRGSFGHHQNERFRTNHYHGSGDCGYNSPFRGRFDDQPGLGGGFGRFPHRTQSRPWRGSPRDSYKRLRPEDL